LEVNKGFVALLADRLMGGRIRRHIGLLESSLCRAAWAFTRLCSLSYYSGFAWGCA
jgi:hypothetical protein